MGFTNQSNNAETFNSGILIAGGNITFPATNTGYLITDSLSATNSVVTFYSPISTIGGTSDQWNYVLANSAKSVTLLTDIVDLTGSKWNSVFSTVRTSSGLWGTGGGSSAWSTAGTVVYYSDGNTGLGTENANERLTVVGHISGSGDVFVSGGNSFQWKDAHAVVLANSAKWDANEADISAIATTSGKWNSAKTTVQENSATWTPAGITRLTDVSPGTAKWWSAHDTVTAASAKWDANEADISVVALASGNWDIGHSKVALNSGNWETADGWGDHSTAGY